MSHGLFYRCILLLRISISKERGSNLRVFANSIILESMKTTLKLMTIEITQLKPNKVDSGEINIPT